MMKILRDKLLIRYFTVTYGQNDIKKQSNLEKDVFNYEK